MAEIDDVLSASFKRAGHQGDAAGVADAIRSRVDAGDIGTPAGASGFGGLLPAVSRWLPWAGVVAVAGFAGGAVGFSGVDLPGAAGFPGAVGAAEGRSSVPTASLDSGVVATGCPGGAGVASLARGQRVLAVELSDDAAHLGVRDPLNTSRIVWVPVGLVVVDDGQAKIDSLPIGGCQLPTLLPVAPPPSAPTPSAPPQSAPTPSAPPPVEVPAAPAPAPGLPQPPQPPPPAPPPGDTTAPTMSQASAAPNPFYNAETVTVKASAIDNVGVASVSIEWSGAVSGSGSMTLVKSQWQFAFSTTAQSFGNVTFTLRASDAAGNQSAPVSVTASHNFFG